MKLKRIKRKLNKKSEVERQLKAVSLRLSLHVKENSKKEFSVPSKLLSNFVGSDPLTNVQHMKETMKINRKFKTTFGKISKIYHSSRTGYPEKLVNDIIKISKIERNGKILDVGCGSGHASKNFIKKGFKLTGLDISKELVSIARKTYSSYPNAKFRVGSFEKTYFTRGAFDLIISGQAWHWIDPKIGYKKACRLLKENGYLALFWSSQIIEKSLLFKKASKIFSRYNPRFSPFLFFPEIARKKLNSTGIFEKARKKVYFTSQKFSRKRYLNLSLTYSWVQKLPKEKRDRLYCEMKELLRHERPEIKIPFKCVLIIAVKNKNSGTI